MIIRIPKINLLYALLVFFSMTPFFLPFPGLGSDLQPYALFLGLLVLFKHHRTISEAISRNIQFLLLLIPVLFAVVFLVADVFSMAAFRGAYNHFSILFVFLALYVALCRYGFPEKQIKVVLWIWILVASVQFFVNKEFLANLISGDREDTFDRGVVALCSEASFFGISCFYFLHLVNRFQKNRVLYMVVVTAMAVLYAQSMQGLLFVAVFYIGLVIDSINSRKGIVLLLGLIAGAVVGYIALLRFAPDSRLVSLLNSFFEEGVQGTVDKDVSATVRLNSIINAIAEAFGNYLIPQGFGRRIGSGFGGLMVELGIFGLLEAVVISYSLCLQYKKLYSRVIYFILVSFILFANTQMGNPQLLFVMATNLYFRNQVRNNEKAVALAK